MRRMMYTMLLVFFSNYPASGAAPTSFTVNDLEAHIGATAGVISTQLALAGEFGRLREALGELSSADRYRQWQEALQHLRTSGPVSTEGLMRQSLDAAMRLLNAAEAGLKAPRWPSERPASAYQAVAAARLQYARKQWPSMRAGEGLVQFIAPIAEVLWWTQGRTDGARVFDGLDDEVSTGAQRIFSNLGLKAPSTTAVAAAAYVPQPVAQAPVYPHVVPGTRDMIDASPRSSTPPAQPQLQTGGFEYNVDRYGGDYRMFDLAADDPQICATTCQSEGQCRAWTFVKSGGGNPAKCWLKNQVPPPRANPNSVSGVARQAAPPRNPNFEYDTDRPGSDYRNFDLAAANPELCAAQCAQEGRCRAWSYVQPGAQGPNARCWLKDQAPNPVANVNWVISGVKRTANPPLPPNDGGNKLPPNFTTGSWTYMYERGYTEQQTFSADGTVRGSVPGKWAVEGSELVVRWSHGWVMRYALPAVNGQLTGTALRPEGSRHVTTLSRQ